MSIFLIIAAILMAFALVCFAVPTAIIGAGGMVWLSASLLSFILHFFGWGVVEVPAGGRIVRR
jgi:uncharacterized membrane-anchored protein YitT (DUF2179 family)